MTLHRYLIAGAKGGQGTTTVATVVAALAAGHGPTRLIAGRPGDVCALTGTPMPPSWSSTTSISANFVLAAGAVVDPGEACAGSPTPDDGSHVVVADLGRLDELGEPHQLEANAVGTTSRWLVVRGPCYLSLRAAIEHPWRPDGIVVLAEAGRPLGPADVSDVVGAPVIAQVPVDAAVARIIDAGLLLARLHRLSAFSGLSRLVRAQLVPEPASVAS